MMPYRVSYYFGLWFAGLISTFVVGCFLFGGAWCCFEQFMYEMSLQVAPSQERIISAFVSIFVYSLVGCIMILFSVVYFLEGFMVPDWYHHDVVTPVNDLLYQISELSDGDPYIGNLIDDIDTIMGSAGVEQPGSGVDHDC